MTRKSKSMSAKTMASDLLLATLEVYNNVGFAEFYFKKWRNDLPLEQLDEFSRLVGSGGAVLDAGCGPGHHAGYLHRIGHKTVGIDLSGEALRIATANFKGPLFQHQDMLETSFADNEFMGIWACASVMHLPQKLIGSQLREFYRLLAQNGILSLTVTVEEAAHFDAFGRYFEAYPRDYLLDRIRETGFDLVSFNERLRKKTTEEKGRPAGWLTIFARKLDT
jgi:SAM-dependent methyltransferase